MTDNEIVKALECEATEKVCVHEVYEPACGIWCKHLHKWCADMSGRSDKNNCSAFKPIESTKRAKAILDLVNRQKAEIEELQKDGETLAIALLKARAEIERLNKFALIRNFNQWEAKIKAEAYKEIAEEIKQKTIAMVCSPDELSLDDYIKCIDNVVREKVGE